MAGRIECLTDEAIIRVVRAVAAAIARLEVIHVRGIATLDRRRGDPQSVQEDLVHALHLTDAQAVNVVVAARALSSRLPETLALMEAGKVNLVTATKVAKATNWLTDAHAGAADAYLASRLPKKNVEQVRRAACYAARKVDPAGAIRRTAQSRKGRGLTLTQRSTVTAKLSISGAPAEKAAEAFSRIESSAKVLMTPKEPRTHEEVCADIALELLLRPYERPGALPGLEESSLPIPQQRSVEPEPEPEDRSRDGIGAARPSRPRRGSGANTRRGRKANRTRLRSQRRRKG